MRVQVSNPEAPPSDSGVVGVFRFANILKEY